MSSPRNWEHIDFLYSLRFESDKTWIIGNARVPRAALFRIRPDSWIVLPGRRPVNAYLLCRTGSPTVVFEAELGDGWLNWQKVQPELTTTTRTCIYKSSRCCAERHSRGSERGSGQRQLPPDRHDYRPIIAVTESFLITGADGGTSWNTLIGGNDPEMKLRQPAFPRSLGQRVHIHLSAPRSNVEWHRSL